ncbi:nSTAND3 domain-containing NTPase [Bacillus cereus]
MAEYNFLTLSSDEFELFSKDIVEKELGIKLENFKSGKDGGIDLRYAPSEGDKIIVQCKRYTDFTSLKSTLKDEVKKVEKLKPERYILVTTAKLNPSHTDMILEMFNGYIKETGDIYGYDRLQTILQDHQEIERKHYKLWLTSSNVLQTIYNNDSFNRSKFTEDEIKNKSCLYVFPENFSKLKRDLEERKVIIISGGPGVGKTSLADMLSLSFMGEEYEFFEITEDINEAEKLYNENIKQIFYYDDFLGRNFLKNGLSKNEDRRIINFMKKIMKSPDKIFIMTTREYILNQAKIDYELFNVEKIDFNKYILDVENFQEAFKAKILYNYLFFSEISRDHLKYIIDNKAYRRIINHGNYSPRLVSRMILEVNFQELNPREYVKMFIKELDYPFSTWGHIYEQDINEYSRWILKLLMIMGDKPVRLDFLQVNFNSFNQLFNNKYDINAFNSAIRELEKTFISIKRGDGKAKERIEFKNPSIADFLIKYSNQNSADNLYLWKSTRYFTPMFSIFNVNPLKQGNGKLVVNRNLIPEYKRNIINRFDEYLDLQNDYSKFRALNKLDEATLLSQNEHEFIFNVFDKSNVIHTEDYVNLFIKYKEVLKSLDIKNIILNLFNEADNIIDIYNLEEINKYFSKECREIFTLLDKESILDKLVDNFINNYDYEIDYDDAISLLQTIGVMLEVNIDVNLTNISGFFAGLEYDSREPDYDDDYYKEYETDRESDNGYEYDSLFESLLSDD